MDVKLDPKSPAVRDGHVDAINAQPDGTIICYRNGQEVARVVVGHIFNGATITLPSITIGSA